MTPQACCGVISGVSAHRGVWCFLLLALYSHSKPSVTPTLFWYKTCFPGLNPRPKMKLIGLLALDPRPLLDPWKAHCAVVHDSSVHSHLFLKVTGFYRPVKPSLKVN